MPLIVEDGSKPQNANAYCSIEFADEYHELMGNTDWASLSDDEKTGALVKATASLDLLYGPRYLSTPTADQNLLWPRYAFADAQARKRYPDSVPVELVKAVAEHALNISNGLNAFPMPSDKANIKSQSVSVGDLSKSVEYRAPLESETYAGFNVVELLLAPILKRKNGMSIRLGR